VRGHGVEHVAGESLTPTDFPVPELILFGLRNLRDLESWGPGEKLRWGITATFGNVPFSVTLEKFGLRLYVPRGLADGEGREASSVRLMGEIASDGRGTSPETADALGKIDRCLVGCEEVKVSVRQEVGIVG